MTLAFPLSGIHPSGHNYGRARSPLMGTHLRCPLIKPGRIEFMLTGASLTSQ